MSQATQACVLALDRGLLEITGPTRAKFLHNLVSNDVENLKPGQGRSAALMDVKGHVIALIRVLAGEKDLVLEMPKDRIDRVQAVLEHYRVAAPVRFKRLEGAVLALFGEGAATLLTSLGIGAPSDLDDHVRGTVAGEEVHVVRASDVPRSGFVIHMAERSLAPVTEGLIAKGAIRADAATLDALRVEEGLPWFGHDVTEANLLHETGLVKTHHSSTKGCYVGQEVIARLEARGGKVNKALRGLRLSTPARAGDVVHDADGKDVGRVTTAAVSSRLGPVALAYVHRTRFDPGTALVVHDAPATVVALPFSQ